MYNDDARTSVSFGLERTGSNIGSTGSVWFGLGFQTEP